MKRLLVLPVFIVLLLAGALFAEEARRGLETMDLKQAFISGALVAKGEGAAPQGDLTDAQKRILALRSAKVLL